MDVTRAVPPQPDEAGKWSVPTETSALPDPGRETIPDRAHGEILEDGVLLGNRYRLTERLGQGGMGTVWRAHDTVIDRDVAVKEPRLPEPLPEESRRTAFARLEREARAAAQIDHPAVVTIFDVISEDGRPWIVMELIEGRTLADVLTGGTLSPAAAARIGLPIVRALAAAHARKVLHRDVKPSNVMLGPGGRVVLTDFGIAHIEGETPVTRTGALIGSADYTAPERVLGRVPGPESDLFALGALLYTAVEGFSPFWRQTRHATLQAVLRAAPQAPLHAGELSDLIMGLLDKEPGRRPSAATAAAVLARVADPDSARESLSRKGFRVRKGVRAGHPNRLRTAVAALITVVVTVAGVAGAVWAGDLGGRAGTGAASAAVPAGWKTERRGGISIAVPAAYEPYDLYDHGGGVAFQLAKGQIHQELLVLRWDVPTGTPRERADYWYRLYRESTRITEQQVTLAEVAVNGRPSMSVTMTFRGDAGQLWRKRELFYDADGRPWRVVVDWAIDNELNTRGDDLFEGAVRTLRTY
ncbi:serine/threonine-protein kinase [Nocardia wallacei]|uniref:serine/threonine-protein kinase n=1 Tax=Nocardia wallacei TaxID=480035 RepID=UPI002455DF32|nr:serine/threonine-protein kinase [Nocardia wallacei]